MEPAGVALYGPDGKLKERAVPRGSAPPSERTVMDSGESPPDFAGSVLIQLVDRAGNVKDERRGTES